MKIDLICRNCGNIYKKSESRAKKSHYCSKEYGFQTLVIWGRELKNINKLNKKIITFHNKKVKLK